MQIKSWKDDYVKRLRRPEAIRWLVVLVAAWLVYLLCGGKGFTLPVVGFSVLMILLVLDEAFFFTS